HHQSALGRARRQSLFDPSGDREPHRRAQPDRGRNGRFRRRPGWLAAGHDPCRLARAADRGRRGVRFASRALGLTGPAAPGEPAGLELRLTAAQRLGEVLGGARFVPLGAGDVAEPRDRALGNRLITTALRRHGHLNIAIGRLLERGLPARAGSFEATLRLALAQLLYLPEVGAHSALFLAVEAVKRDRKAAHLAKLMNAVLRRAQADADALRELPSAALFPEKLAARWRGRYGAEALDGFARALLEGAPLDLTLKDPAAAELPGATPVFADVVRLDHRDRRIEDLPGYAEGRWWVQDLAASLPARLLALPPGARVADLCAAPGGKTAQLIKAGYAVTAVDSDRVRLDRL